MASGVESGSTGIPFDAAVAFLPGAASFDEESAVGLSSELH